MLNSSEAGSRKDGHDAETLDDSAGDGGRAARAGVGRRSSGLEPVQLRSSSSPREPRGRGCSRRHLHRGGEEEAPAGRTEVQTRHGRWKKAYFKTHRKAKDRKAFVKREAARLKALQKLAACTARRPRGPHRPPPPPPTPPPPAPGPAWASRAASAWAAAHPRRRRLRLRPRPLLPPSASGAPRTRRSQGPAEGSATDSSTVAFQVHVDGGGRVQCSAGMASRRPCKSPTTYAGLEDGPHRFPGLTAKDVDGNLDPTPAARAWNQVAPTPPKTRSVATPISPSEPTAIGNSTEFLYPAPTPMPGGAACPARSIPREWPCSRRVFSRAACSGLPAVRVTVVDHPELGQTVTREDGRFDIAVNGGEPLAQATTSATESWLSNGRKTPRGGDRSTSRTSS